MIHKARNKVSQDKSMAQANNPRAKIDLKLARSKIHTVVILKKRRKRNLKRKC
jgi:hypothetical protein